MAFGNYCAALISMSQKTAEERRGIERDRIIQELRGRR
jgi:hypothetical protein